MRGSASSLAELDALTVSVTPSPFNKCIISRFRCLSDVSHRRLFFAGRRNHVHHIVHHRRLEGGRGEGDDNEAEGTIVPQPADPPEHLQGSVASVKPGHENLPPLVLVGDDNETLRRLGDCCNGWVLLWPKSVLHLEAAGSTPTSTQPQQGMNINTPPTQLVSAVVLGDRGQVRKRTSS